jgi:(E)-4-hydroxy-3-methylbut-2-enyl-diphosphate synthase
VFVDGALRTTLRGEGLVKEFIGILDDYVAKRYGAGPDGSAAPRAS